MLLQKIRARSDYIIFLILCMTNIVFANYTDVRRCLVYEEEVTEAPKVVAEDVMRVLLNSNTEPITKVKYGQHVRLTCDIKVPFSVNITWYARSRELTSGRSGDQKELDIKSMNMEYHGEYITCEATLLSTPENGSSDRNLEVLQTYGTNIKVIDLAPPLISNLTPINVTVIESDKFTLSCKIVSGIPQPSVSWYVKRSTDTQFRDLFTSSEELVVKNATFADDGQYRCVANNVRGQDNRVIDVVVLKKPVVTIDGESNIRIPYGNTVKFPCKIYGYPMPNTAWKDSKGNELNFEDIFINWHEKTNLLKLQAIKKSNNYSCYAENSLGKSVANVSVTVLSPFVVHERPNEKTNVHYGASINIICNITATFPMKIKWFHQKSANSSELTEIHTDKQFNIVSNGTMLQVQSMGFDQVGNYTCEGSLISDENEKISFATDVEIDDLAPPTLSDRSKIVVMETNWITLSCIIAGGVPRPTLSWQAMKHGEVTYKDLAASTEDLDVENITIADAGLYRCVAKNAIGENTQVTDVIVRKAPVTDIVEGSEITVIYGRTATFTCIVVGYPLPSLSWTDHNTISVNHMSEDHLVHQHKRTSKITKTKVTGNYTYFCNAENSLGKAESSIHINVLPAFIVHQYPQATTNVHYEASTNLVCNITSSLPMRIKWFHATSEIHTSTKHTISANETVLYISSVGLDEIGKYTCEATLISDTVSDDDPKEVFSSNVQIDDLKPPKITSYSGATVTIKNLEELSLVCKATGNPEPVMKWQAQVAGSSSYQPIGDGDSLCSTNFGYAQAGTYKCTASSIAGEDSRLITVAIT